MPCRPQRGAAPATRFPSQETHEGRGRFAGRLESVTSQWHTGGRGGPRGPVTSSTAVCHRDHYYSPSSHVFRGDRMLPMAVCLVNGV